MKGRWRSTWIETAAPSPVACVATAVMGLLRTRQSAEPHVYRGPTEVMGFARGGTLMFGCFGHDDTARSPPGDDPLCHRLPYLRFAG